MSLFCLVSGISYVMLDLHGLSRDEAWSSGEERTLNIEKESVYALAMGIESRYC